VLLVVLLAMPAIAAAQGAEATAQITGVIHDSSGAVMPGVLVEVTSPALIERVRSTISSDDGRYRITNLPVGTYSVSFALDGFQRQQRNDIILTSGFAATVDGTMTVGQRSETVVVTGTTPTVDVSNARQAVVFQGDDIRELPTPRNVSSLLALTPGITSGYAPGTGSGICIGGVGVFCNPGVPGFNVGDLDSGRANNAFNTNCPTAFGFVAGGSSSGCDGSATNLSQGRVMVDGAVINAGSSVPIGGLTGGFVADIANAQEINIQVSGALGESETGGASINIIPRTGGNTFAGNYHTTYTRQSWFDSNNGRYPTASLPNQVLYDYDVSGAYGGPIKRDHLWFYSLVRRQGKKAFPFGGEFFPNKWEGVWGYNYQPDRTQPSVTYTNKYMNGNTRITWQASRKNKFNIFWDEQDFCQDPCDGVVSTYTSPVSWWSVAVKPNRLQQVSWTNPFTNKLLFEAGLSITSQTYDTTHHRFYRNPQEIPAISETGDTAGGDEVATRVNAFAGGAFFALTSGSLNGALGFGSEMRVMDNYRSRASASYVTGRHNAKIGYDGGYYRRKQTNNANDLRMTYNYTQPNAACVTTLTCGNTAIVNGKAQFPNDPDNLGRRPRPATVVLNTGEGTFDEAVNYIAFYAQDQWTRKRITISGALRYDHATSSYNPTCVGGDGTEPWMPVQIGGAYAGQRRYCTPKTDGVNYHDITPRWGVAYDIFGNGRTSLKWNMGKYLNAAGLSGIYSGANPARRTVNSITRNWNDADADRVVDCDPLASAANGECATFSIFSDPVRYGRDPFSLDASGLAVGLAETQCGRQEQGIPPAVAAYCAAYGESLLDGWGRRQSEWQLGIGIQHEILPRLSGEVTYNRRLYRNLQVSDQLGVGCDRFNAAQDITACQEGYLNFTSPSYDFYSVLAPTDPRLPGGGGYRVVGLNATALTVPSGNPRAITYMDALNYTWNGIDTNVVWRAPGGVRLNGGTSTARTRRDTCFAEVDGPNVRGRDNHYVASCQSFAPFQTRINGTAAYTIPKIDVLVSTVFQSFPGVNRQATLTFSKEEILWNPASAARATRPCATPANGVGCAGNNNDAQTVMINLLNNNELYGERVTTFDLKLAKNIRFHNKRAAIGVDVYNLFNSDAIQDYVDTYTLDNPATPQNENQWGQPFNIIAPRFARLSVQFYF
jgi:hypothetical protein